MDLSDDNTNDILCLDFNQDNTCFSVGTENGFFVKDTDPLDERFSRDFDDGGIGKVEMLFRCNLLALVGGGKHPKFDLNGVMIWDDIQKQCIAELQFKTPVKGVKLRRDRIIVILEKMVFIYNFQDLRVLYSIRTYQNPKGLCAINTGDEMVMATLGEKLGVVRIDMFGDTHVIRNIPAHANPIGKMALNSDGSRLATASERGTLIRLFDTYTGDKIKEFRRGAQPATIHSISFNKSGNSICCSSDKQTIHVYNIESDDGNSTSALKFVSPLVPFFGSVWSARQFSIPESKSICAFSPNDEEGKESVIALGASGVYYKFTYNIYSDTSEEIEPITDTFI
eukprot:TRINITY_DN4898_c0_g1_i1.p1 TRINITY_DN4898_c0_g1~~TRINITY_DN4898_c0_g1_i1.p1  ORF type:complete len:351 (-),score=70.69 TRINITY_DN4898_c0_g1_i1:24-1040(-)